MPLLSVVVPFHNVERYIEACLESLRRQTFSDLEVVLVDDGAGDSSRLRAERFCAEDSRFRIVSQQNQGPGPARNTGIEHSAGRFLAFVDADDVVHPDAYRRLVGSLAETGSDLAVSNAGRFNNLGVSWSYAHQVAITGDRRKTTIGERPELGLDRMVWNKVFRRDFWDGHDLTFPALMMGEDFPVCMAAHVRATSVDVIGDVLYWWRERDGGEPSITQRSAAVENLADRLLSAETVLDLVDAGAPGSSPLVRHHFGDIDVTAMTAALAANDAADHPRILELARRLLVRLGPETIASSPPFFRVQAALVELGDTEALIELHRFRHRYGPEPAVERRGRIRRRFVARWPHLDSGRVPESAYELATEPPIEICAEDVVWDGEVLAVRGVIEAAIALGSRSKVTAWLERERDSRRIPLAVNRQRRRRGFLGEDLAGFGVRIDPALLLRDGEPDGFWALRFRVSNRDVDVELRATVPSFERGRYVLPRWLGPDRRWTVQPLRGGLGFGLMVRTPKALLGSAVVEDQRFVLTGRLADQPTGEPSLVLVGRHGIEHRLPALWVPDPTGAGFRAEVPTDLLAEMPEYLSPVATQLLYDAHLDVDGVRRPIMLEPGHTSIGVRVGHRSVSATRNFSGVLQFVEGRTAPRAVAVRWTGPDTLRFDGVWDGTEQLPARVVLEHFEHPADGIDFEVALSCDGPRYRFDLDVADLVERQRALPDPYKGLHPPPWHLVLPFADHLAPQIGDRDLLDQLPEPRDVLGCRVSVTVGRFDVVRLRIGD